MVASMNGSTTVGDLGAECHQIPFLLCLSIPLRPCEYNEVCFDEYGRQVTQVPRPHQQPEKVSLWSVFIQGVVVDHNWISRVDWKDAILFLTYTYF